MDGIRGGGNSSRNYDSDGDGVNDSWEHIKVGSARDKQYKEWQAAHSGGSSPLSSLYRELGGGSIGSFDDYYGQPAGGRAEFGAQAQASQFSIAWPRGLLGIPVQVPDATPLVDSIVTTLTLSESNRVWVTYTLRDLSGGMVVYVGRASGFGTPAEVMMRRFAYHHMRLLGFGDPVLDKWQVGPIGYSAIRGREQQLYDHYDPLVANRIRPVARGNPNGYGYWEASNYAFGKLARYTGY